MSSDGNKAFYEVLSLQFLTFYTDTEIPFYKKRDNVSMIQVDVPYLPTITPH